jgi:hypothetical protein
MLDVLLDVFRRWFTKEVFLEWVNRCRRCGTLVVLVILGAFALARFAIYAVLTLARERQ